MVIKLTWDENNVIESGPGYVLLKLRFYTQFAQILWLFVTKGSTKQDFNGEKRMNSGYLNAGQHGGISFERIW